MTKVQAEEILRRPRFGDPDCIKAVERLADEPRVKKLRRFLVGKYIQCGACGGTGDRCKLCTADGSILITQEWADTWEIDELVGAIDDMGLEDMVDLATGEER